MTKKSPHDLETALRTTESFVLSADERRDMKEQLLAHAAFHSKTSANSTKATRSPALFWRTSIASAFCLLVIITTSASAYGSLPGELLYPMKVHVVEPLTLPLEHPGLSDISAQTLRLERRLTEIKTLQLEGALSVEATSDVIDSVTDHTDALITALTDPASDASDAETLHSLDTASALIEAHETLLASSSEATVVLSNIEDDLDAAYDETITDLATGNASSSLTTYIDTSLDRLEAELVTSDLSTTTIDAIEIYIETASSSLSEADLVEAHGAISEAQQIILTDDYIEAPLTSEE